MKSFLILLLLGSWQITQAQSIPSSETGVLFRSVNVVPMDREEILINQDVLVKNGVITAIAKGGSIQVKPGMTVIEGKNRYLMPGLAEMHAHVPPNADRDSHLDVLRLFLANGVTTIRGMLGHPSHLELREQLNSGKILGPHFLTSGPSLNGNTVKSPGQAVDSVRSQHQAGYDFMKLHPGLLLDNFDALVQEAHRMKMDFAGHVSYDVGIWHAIESGYRTIDHMDGFIEGLVPDIRQIPEAETGLFGMYIHQKADVSLLPRLFESLKKHQVWVVPTQSLAERWMSAENVSDKLASEPEMVYMSRQTIENWKRSKDNLQSDPRFQKEEMKKYLLLRRKMIREGYRAGVGFLLGSDAPQVFNVPGFSVHHELHYLVDAGLTPYEALRTGTVNVGQFLHRSNQGMVRKGAVADLVLVTDNPLEKIDNTSKIEGVMVGGRWLSRADLDRLLSQSRK